MKSILRIARTALPSVLMLVAILLTKQYIFDIAASVLLVFPLVYILNGILCTRFRTDWVIGVLLVSLLFLILTHLLFNIGGSVPMTLIYTALSAAAFGIKHLLLLRAIKKAK